MKFLALLAIAATTGYVGYEMFIDEETAWNGLMAGTETAVEPTIGS